MSDQHIETVKNLKKKLDKGVSFGKTMHILYKLQKIPISVNLLKETGIGYKLWELSKQEKDNDVGKTAKLMIWGWKKQLRNETAEDSESESTKNRREPASSPSIEHSESDDNHDNQRETMDSDGFENNDETGCDDGDDETPPRLSDRSDESVHKKKNKKKKKQKIKDNDDEQSVSGRKKDKKRKHRENNDYPDRESSKRHKSLEHCSSNKSRLNKEKTCDKALVGMGGDESKFLHRPESDGESKIEAPAPRRLISDDDMFGAVLNMGDKAQNLARNSLKTAVSNCGPRTVQKMPPQSMSPQSLNRLWKTNESSSCTSTNNDFKNMAGIKFKGRTQVFAGTSRLPTVPKVFKLQDICKHVLMNHVDKICEVGDLPYFILKPVFQKCNVQQLRQIEHYNPQLLEETDELWRDFCEKDFKNKLADHKQFNSWRDFYNHLVQERDRKLENITEKINSKQRQAVPERKTQALEVHKVPREVRRRAERFANAPYSQSSASSSVGKSCLNLQSLKNSKPKRAPLMQKLFNLRNGKKRR